MNFKLMVSKLKVIVSRVVLICILFQLLLQQSKGDFLTQGLLSLQSIDDYGNMFFNFVKILMVLSTFFVGFYSSILFNADLSEGYDQILKYKSTLKKQYIFFRLMLQCRVYLLDIAIWLVGFIFASIQTQITLQHIVLFLCYNLVYIIIINIMTKNALIVYVLYTVLFLGQNVIWHYSLLTVIVISINVVMCYLHMDSWLREDES